MELNQETLKKAYNYLSKDPCLDHLINKFSNNIDISERFNENYPLALAYLIIEQQVSFKAAITIKKRFIKKVEGHVPYDAISKLLSDRPDIKGITVPGMPAGSNVPGMETINERAKFDVLAVNNDGSTFVWKQYE